jgi:3-oxoacyl-[acyl-carrier-protein] synthase-3
MKKNYQKPNLGLGIYLPERVLDNEELERRRIMLPSGKLLQATQILEKIGVERRHIAKDNQTVADMAYLAAKEALGENIKVDFILTSSSHPTPYHIAGEIKKRFDFETAEVLDIHAACSGSALMFGYLFENAKALQGKRVLLVAAEKFSKSVVDLLRPDAMKLDASLGQTIFGDGAAAIQFIAGRDLIVHYCLNKALPDLSGKTNLILMAMGDNKFVEPYIVHPVAASPTTNEFPKGYFTQNGPRVFEDVQNNVPGLIREAVQRAGFETKDIDLVVVHSGSRRVVEALQGRLAAEFQVYSDYKDANMSSVSLLYSFIKAVQEERIGRGSKVVLAGFGAGSPELYSSTVVIELK